jgi:two-component system, NtrC family, response regulator PilR
MAGTTVLVVDDEQNMLLTVQFILETAGYAVTTARSGEEALQAARALAARGEGFDLVLTDIQMQGLTGLELIDGLRAAGIPTPVLVMTGYGNGESVKELKRRGFARILEKPFDEEDLLRKVRETAPGGC